MNSIGPLGQRRASTRSRGLDSIDLWVGGLAEVTNVFGGLLGSTFNYVFENQLTDLQNGDRLYYLARTPGMNLRTQLEGNSFAELIMRNTNAHSLKADAFATADCKFELKNLNGTAGGLHTSTATRVADDPQHASATSRCCCSGSPTAPSSTAHATPSTRPASTARASTTAPPATTGSSAATTATPSGVATARDWIEGGDGADIALGGEGRRHHHRPQR